MTDINTSSGESDLRAAAEAVERACPDDVEADGGAVLVALSAAEVIALRAALATQPAAPAEVVASGLLHKNPAPDASPVAGANFKEFTFTAQAPAAPSVGEPVIARVDYLERVLQSCVAGMVSADYVQGYKEALAHVRFAFEPPCTYCGGTGIDGDVDDRGAPIDVPCSCVSRATPPAAPAATEAPSDKLDRGMRALMGRLASLLDEDQFKDCEDIVRQAGVAPAVADINEIAGKFAAGRDEYGRVFFNGQDWDRFVEALAAPTTAAAVGASDWQAKRDLMDRLDARDAGASVQPVPESLSDEQIITTASHRGMWGLRDEAGSLTSDGRRLINIVRALATTSSAPAATPKGGE